MIQVKKNTEGPGPKRTPGHEKAPEVAIEINLDAKSSFFVECLAEQIMNQAAASGQLRNVREAVASVHLDDSKLSVVRLRLVLDEVLAVR